MKQFPGDDKTQMRWLVEISAIEDKRLLADLLAEIDVELYLEENKTYLISQKFEQQPNSTEVWKRAEEIRNDLSEVNNGVPDVSLGFKLGDIHEQVDNHCRKRYAFGTGMGGALFIIGGGGFGSAASTQEISEAERNQLEAEKSEHEYQKKLARCHRYLSIRQDERALKVHRFLQQKLTPARMYHIYELIEDDVGKKNLINLAPRKDWDRFKGSVNNPEVFGDDARHIVPNTPQLPPDPMNLREAQAFISRVADLWLEQKACNTGVE